MSFQMWHYFQSTYTNVLLFGKIKISYQYYASMPQTKEKISITISRKYLDLLEKQAEYLSLPKSQVVENALKEYFLQKLDADTKKIASLQIDDLPSEDEWLLLQSEIQ